MYHVNGKAFKCSVEVTLDLFNDKWKLRIIWHLLEGEKRFKDLNEEVSEITQKTLAVKLRELEVKHLVNRECFAQVPPKVVYSLTPIGRELWPILEAMFSWGRAYAEAFGEVTPENNCKIS